MRHPLIQRVEAKHLKTDIPVFRVSDQVRVYVRVVEGERTRLQVFEGIVIARRGTGTGATFTVRRVSFGEGIERIFPLHAPTVDKVEVVKKGTGRRARLYTMRKDVVEGAR